MEKINFTFSKILRPVVCISLMLCLFSGLNEVSAQGGDDCASAVAVVAGTHTTTTLMNGGAANVCFTGATNAQWFSYTPTAAGTIDITSQNDPALIDTRLSVYDGTCAALNCIASDDDGGTGFTSIVTGVAVCPSTTYFIEWDDNWSATGFMWDLTFNPATTGPTNTSSLAPDGCTATITWTSCDATAGVEVCPSGVAPGGAGCVVFLGAASPYVVDLCAAGFAPGSAVDITVTDGVGTGPASTLNLPGSFSCTTGTPMVTASENFDAGGAQTGSTSGQWNIDSNGTGSSGTGPLSGSAPSAPNYIYYEASALNNGATYTVFTDVDLRCFDDARLTYQWHAFGLPGDVTAAIQASSDNANWVTIASVNSGDTPNQSDPFTFGSASLAAYVGGPVSIRLLTIQNDIFEGDVAFDDFIIETCESAMPPTTGPSNVCSLGADGCTATIEWETCDPAMPAGDVEICPAGVASGGVGCVTFTAVTSPFVVDLCASGFGTDAGPTTVNITVGDIGGTGPACPLVLPTLPLMCAGGAPALSVFFDDFDAGGMMTGSTGGQWNIDWNGTSSTGTGPLSGTAPSAPNYLYLEGSGTATGSVYTIFTNLDLTCIDGAQLTYDWHFAAGNFPILGSAVIETQVSPTGANVWTPVRTHVSGETPAQADPFTPEVVSLTPFLGQKIDLRFICTIDTRNEDFAIDNLEILVCSSEACPGVIAAATAAAPVIVDQTCTMAGSISAPAVTGCPPGSSIEYSTDNMTWSATVPSYINTAPVTVYTRCSCDCDPTGCNVSPGSSATTAPLGGDPLVVSCPATPVSLTACTNEAAILAAYNAWIAGFSVAGGVGTTTNNLASIPALPAFVCGGAVSLSFTLTASDDCGTETCMSTFNVAAATPLTVSCPAAPVSLAACTSEADIMTAYTAWAAGFAVNDGCNATSNIASIPALPAYVCGAAVSLSFTLSATDDCNTTPLTCMSTFDVAASTPLAVTCPAAVSLPACSSDADIMMAYNAWIAGFTNTGGCNATVTSTPPSLPPYVFGGPVSLTYGYMVMGDCGMEMCTSTFTVPGVGASLSATCPAPVNLPACATDMDIMNAYMTWASGFVAGGGCNVSSNIASIPPLPAYVCGAAVNLSFTLTATDPPSAPQSCTSTFTVAGTTPLTVSCPAAVNLAACTDEAAILAAYTAWTAGFTVNDGCNTTSNIAMIPALPAFVCGGAVSLSFDLSATDDCGTQMCSSTFDVAAATPLTISCPGAVSLASCTSDGDIQTAYAAWVAGFVVNDGCNTTSNIAMIPALPAFVCGGAVSLSFDLSATDDCGTQMCSSTFEVAAATPLTISCPGAVSLASCTSDADIQTAYAAWVAAFGVNDGCNTTSNIAMIPALPAYVCGGAVSLSFTLTATDDCGTESCSSTFDVGAAVPLTTSCPAPVSLPSCSTEGDIQAAYNAWLAGFTFSDGCNASVTSTAPALPAYVCDAAVALSYTYTVTGDCGPISCTSTFNVAPAPGPTAVCNDITITLDGTGNYTLTPADVSAFGAGSTAACNFTMDISPNVFDCTNVGPMAATLTVTDDCGATDMCSAVINVIASQFCIDNFPPLLGNENGPMISDPCTCRGNGEFDEEVLVESNAPGQLWTVTFVSGLAPWSTGDVMVDNGDNTYSAVGIHLDGVGFVIEVESIFYPGLRLGITNVCHYPVAQIDVDLDVLCENTPIINLVGSAGLQSDGVTPIAGVGEFKVNGVVTPILDISTLGVGSHTVEFCFDAGEALGFKRLLSPGAPPVVIGPPDGANSLQESQDDPGCEHCVSEIIVIAETPDELACNDGIQVSLEGNCEALITADMVLEGSYGCFDDYSVALSYNGSGIANPLASNYINQTITAQVTHVPSGNVCWGTLTVEDKLGPVFDCDIMLLDKLELPVPTAGPDVFYFANGGFGLGTNPIVFVPCDYDLSTIPAPTAIDNCDVDATEFLISEDVQDLATSCPTFFGFTNTKRIDRRYGSSDFYGNAGDECTITIMIYIPTIEFPDDITWTCEQYDLFPNITDPTALHPFIIENAAFLDASTCHTTVSGDEFAGIEPYTGFNYWTDAEALDVDLDPHYDDNFDNPINDSSGACGTPTDETDTECIHNISAIRVGCGATGDCDTDPHDHRENIITVPKAWVGPFAPGPQYPLYRAPNFNTTPPLAAQPAHPVNGLEDADLLELSGSGVPNLFEQHGECNHTFTHSDQILEACTGQGTDKTFKILRTWTALNWCTGLVTTDIQVIKVIDKRGPVISIDAQELISDQTNDDGNHTTCASSGLIAPPTVEDLCSGVTSVRVFTPAGEATAVTDASGNVIGYRIPSPYLEMGTHTITVEAKDACGGRSTATAQVTVIDGIPPVNICREVTQVALASPTAGITSVAAAYFDEGSYDYCSDIYFKVRKMELGTCDNANIDKDNEQDHRIGNLVAGCTSAPQEWFDDDVKFCCDEIGTTVNVILRVYDEDPDFLATCGPKTGAVASAQNAEGLHFDPSPVCNAQCKWRPAASLNDNYNDCMIEVLVEDKSRPTCVAPVDVWINCDELPENVDYDDDTVLDDLFGTASVSDNCGADLEYVSVNNQLDLCGVGQVTRTFRAVDASGSRSLGSCRQVIMVQPVTSYCITFPEDFEGECDNNNNPGEIESEEIGCDLLAISKETRPFNAGGPTGDECRKDLVTWKVINWCEYDGISAPTVVNRDGNGDGRVDSGEYCSTGTALIYQPNPTQIQYPSTGYYSWEQHVKIFDNTAPEVSYDGDVKFQGGDLDEDPCTGQVDIEIVVDEQCTDATTITWELSAFSSNFSSATFNGDNSISGRYPLGTHTARFYVSDDCGNTSTIDITFDVVDAKAPTPVCYNGLSIDVMPASGMVEVWATDFDASSFDYCQDIKFAINRIEDTNGDGFITSDDHVTTVPNTSNVIFTCDDVGTLVNVQLWVGEVPGDGCNDWDYCTTYMQVQDNNGSCPNSRTASITGTVSDEKGENVENVEVNINGDMTSSMMTSNDGQFDFGVTEGNDYSITPMKTDDIRNGVSTFDLALISKHVLNVQSLNSPYKLIAADANRSGSVTTLDLVAIRKVVLFVANDFPNNTSWRFVDKDYIFTNPQNPFAQVFPEVKNYNNISGVNMADFVGIKIGDVSGDAKANGLTNIDDRTFNETFYLNTEDKTFKAGERVEVAINANLSTIEGYQATLNFDSKALELVDIETAELTKDNFGMTMSKEGIITMGWNGTAVTNEAFTLIFSAKAKGTVSEELSISSQYTKAEAYANSDLLNVGLTFGTTAPTTTFALHQNMPNPFKSETTIGFDLPKADEATLTISDVSGKVLRVIKGNYPSGYNSIVIDLTNNLPYGVLIYELETSTDKATKKMTLMR